jgi:hypothetical protein
MNSVMHKPRNHPIIIIVAYELRGLGSPEYELEEHAHCDICTGVVLERPVNAKLRRKLPKDVPQN